MTLAIPTALAAARAFTIALLAVPAALGVLPWLRGLSPLAQRSAFAATALVFFTPAMLAGYGWLPTVTRWPANSNAREIFYCAMLWVRFTPVAALAIWIANPGPDPTARHCMRLSGGTNFRWHLRELGSAPWLAAGIVFLFAFQEFDLATSWGIRTWTVALFDAQTGGLKLSESLRLALPALAVELAVVVPLLWAVRRVKRAHAANTQGNSRAWLPSFMQFAAGPVCFIALPSLFVLRLGFGGFAVWFESFAFAREMTNSLLLALVCSLLAWLLSGTVSGRPAVALAMPGLLGPLLLSLLALAVVRPFDSLARSALPLVIALVLQLLPLAMLLRSLLRSSAAPAALHIARTAGARAAEWTLSQGPAAGAVLLLFGVAYSDFTASALLAPPQFTTVFVRIFNLMHYGQGAVLSAALFIAVATPLLCLWLTRHLLRLYVARRVR